MKCKVIILLSILLLLGACEIKKPSLPVWDVDIKVPLINEHYYVSDLLDNEHLVTGDDDLLYLTTEGDIETSPSLPVAFNPNISIDNLPVFSGISAQQDIAFGDTGDNATLCYGEIKSGLLKIKVANVNPAAGTWNLKIIIQTIKDAQGNPLELSYTQATPWQSINLSTHHLGVFNNEDPLTELTAEITSSSALPLGSPLAEVSILIDQAITFSVFQGRFDNYEVAASGAVSSIDIEYPLNLDEAIELHEAYIEIAISNQMGFSCEFQGNIKATRGLEEITIPIKDDEGNNFCIEADTVGNPSILEFSNGIAGLLQIMPEHIEIVGAKFIISSACGYGTMRESDMINAHYTVMAPFLLTLHDKPISIETPTQISISAENQERISKNVLEASLSLKVMNTIPVGATAFAYFANHELIDPEDPATYSFVKELTLGSFLTHPSWQELELLGLNRAELDIFSAPEVYLKWVFHFEESIVPVEIHAGLNDYVWIKGQILASLRVEDL